MERTEQGEEMKNKKLIVAKHILAFETLCDGPQMTEDMRADIIHHIDRTYSSVSPWWDEAHEQLLEAVIYYFRGPVED
jgi:molybdopterin-guanine dinucleotide biosynthesis protein A